MFKACNRLWWANVEDPPALPRRTERRPTMVNFEVRLRHARNGLWGQHYLCYGTFNDIIEDIRKSRERAIIGELEGHKTAFQTEFVQEVTKVRTCKPGRR